MATTFSDALREERDARGWSQGALADKLPPDLRVSYQRIGQWERDDGQPSPAQVFALEVALELTPGTLSRLLGFLPVGEPPPPTLEALAVDRSVNAEGRRLLRGLYETVRRQS